MTSKSRSGNTGDLIRARIAGNSDQASTEGGPHRARSGTTRVSAESKPGLASIPPENAIPAALMPLIKFRRFVPFLAIILTALSQVFLGRCRLLRGYFVRPRQDSSHRNPRGMLT